MVVVSMFLILCLEVPTDSFSAKSNYTRHAIHLIMILYKRALKLLQMVLEAHTNDSCFLTNFKA